MVGDAGASYHYRNQFQTIPSLFINVQQDGAFTGDTALGVGFGKRNTNLNLTFRGIWLQRGQAEELLDVIQSPVVSYGWEYCPNFDSQLHPSNLKNVAVKYLAISTKPQPSPTVCPHIMTPHLTLHSGINLMRRMNLTEMALSETPFIPRRLPGFWLESFTLQFSCDVLVHVYHGWTAIQQYYILLPHFLWFLLHLSLLCKIHL